MGHFNSSSLTGYILCRESPYAYDNVGNRTALTDALNNTTRYVYDELNRQVRVINAENNATTTAYDAIGNILGITDAVGNTTSYTYDALNRQITDTNQLGKTRALAYDAVGDLIETSDRNGRKRTYDYDALNRQTAEHWLDNLGNDIRTFSYGYDAVGHLLTATNPDSSYAYTYDLRDRLSSVDNTGTVGVPAVKFAYNYDAAGNLVSVTDAINGTLKSNTAYTYDVLNRVRQITQSGVGVQSKRVDMSYDGLDRLTGLNRYGDVAGTLDVADSSYAYDAAGRLTNLAHKRGASTIAGYGFTYDNANRITQSSGTDGTQDYSYDDTNQLTGVDNSALADEAYSYDANGNRTNAGYGTGTNNQLLTDGVYNYTYDDEGNRTRRVEIATGKVTEYKWDYRNRLTSVTFKDAAGVVTKTIEYAYDGDNQRIGKKIDGVVTERYVIDRNQISLVFDGAGVQTHRYLYGTQVDQVLADETQTGMVWALADRLGTVSDLVDNSGGVVNHITYDSFGRVVSQSNSGVVFRYGYTGREQDNETGLDYYRARYYDAGVGRFISEDPIGFSAGDTNIYRYVGNSPTNAIDPSGLYTLVIPGGFGEFRNLTTNIKRLPGRKYGVGELGNPKDTKPTDRALAAAGAGKIFNNAINVLNTVFKNKLGLDEPLVFVAHSDGNTVVQPLISAIRKIDSLPAPNSTCRDPKKIVIQVVQLDPTIAVKRPDADLVVRVGSNKYTGNLFDGNVFERLKAGKITLPDITGDLDKTVDIKARLGTSHNDLLNDYDVLLKTQRAGIQY